MIRWRGEHVFNPSNIGLVLCFLVLGRDAGRRRSTSGGGRCRRGSALALAIIVAGGFAILRRLQLLRVARRLLARVRGRDRRARARRPRDDRALASRPDHRLPLLVGARHLARGARLPLLHDHRPEDGAAGRAGPARRTRVALGLLAALLIAPTTTEFASKVALLGSLAIVCLALPVLRALRRAARPAARVCVAARARRLRRVRSCVVAARRGDARATAYRAAARAGRCPPITDRRPRAACRRSSTARRAQLIATRPRRSRLPARRRTARSAIWLEPGGGQGPPIAVATLGGAARTACTAMVAAAAWALARRRTPRSVARSAPSAAPLARAIA